MAGKEKRDFCINCRKETKYDLREKSIVKNIRNKAYTFKSRLLSVRNAVKK